MPDPSRAARWAGPGFLTLSLVLVPWTVHLAMTLPPQQVSRNYDVAWVGFDVALVVALGATGITAFRRSTLVSPVAATTGTLLLTDAWFDVLTAATHRDLLLAVVLAAVVELPLAALCFWVGGHARELVLRRVSLGATPTPTRNDADPR